LWNNNNIYQKEKMAAALDSTERMFLDCLKEIRNSYVEFNKPLRLRIEKWVEKLSMANSKNITWRRHRNAYAKLLLGMIVEKNLTDPFHQMPPDGPLPSFPVQYNHKFKSMLGSHETSFWRELFRNIQDGNDRGTVDRSSNFDDQMIPVIQSYADHRMDELLNRRPLSPSRPINREIEIMAALIKEQTARIQLLEQQLRDERLQHELQIQRLQYAHRIEIASLSDTTAFSHSLQSRVLADKTQLENLAAKHADQRMNWPAPTLPGVPHIGMRGELEEGMLSKGFGTSQNNAGIEKRGSQAKVILAPRHNSSSAPARLDGALGQSYTAQGPEAERLSTSTNIKRNGLPAATGRNDPFFDFLLSERNVDEYINVEPVTDDVNVRRQGVNELAGSDDEYMNYLSRFQAEIRSLN
jgi:hypothetical protein